MTRSSPGAAIKKANPVSMVTFVCLALSVIILFLKKLIIAIYITGIVRLYRMK